MTAILPVSCRASIASTAPSAIWSLPAKTARRSGYLVKRFSMTDIAKARSLFAGCTATHSIPGVS
jgi:hypothetical protein